MKILWGLGIANPWPVTDDTLRSARLVQGGRVRERGPVYCRLVGLEIESQVEDLNSPTLRVTGIQYMYGS